MEIPQAAGIGLRTAHLAAFAAEDSPTAPWLEIHSETFLCDGGPRLAMLDAVVAQYPLSCHGVGLSLGSADGLDPAHLARLKKLFARVQPGLISEHLAWSSTGGAYLNDLLPLPYTERVLDIVAANVAAAQDSFGRRILVENPSAYIAFADETMGEAKFLTRLVERTGCGILLDINNVYVSAANTGGDAAAYLRALPTMAISEIHLAGHSVANGMLIDTHDARVSDAVWALYADTIARIGARPTLIEWDRDVPEISVLLGEAHAAQVILDQRAGGRPHAA